MSRDYTLACFKCKQKICFAHYKTEDSMKDGSLIEYIKSFIAGYHGENIFCDPEKDIHFCLYNDDDTNKMDDFIK